VAGKIARDRRIPSIFIGCLFSDGTPLADKEETEDIVKKAVGDYPAPDCSCGAYDEGAVHRLSTKMSARLQDLFHNLTSSECR
jgi:hypothetical protein